MHLGSRAFAMLLTLGTGACVLTYKPGRMSESDILSWTRLSPPRMDIYVCPVLLPACPHLCPLPIDAMRAQMHSICDPCKGSCAETLRGMQVGMAGMTGMPPPPPPVYPKDSEDPQAWPLMGACAMCNEEETMKMAAKVCTGCNLTRCVALFPGVVGVGRLMRLRAV
jgi:hypothetical protein